MNLTSYKNKRHILWLFLKSEQEKPLKKQNEKLIKRLAKSHADCCKKVRELKFLAVKNR